MAGEDLSNLSDEEVEARLQEAMRNSVANQQQIQADVEARTGQTNPLGSYEGTTEEERKRLQGRQYLMPISRAFGSGLPKRTSGVRGHRRAGLHPRSGAGLGM